MKRMVSCTGHGGCCPHDASITVHGVWYEGHTNPTFDDSRIDGLNRVWLCSDCKEANEHGVKGEEEDDDYAGDGWIDPIDDGEETEEFINLCLGHTSPPSAEVVELAEEIAVRRAENPHAGCRAAAAGATDPDEKNNSRGEADIGCNATLAGDEDDNADPEQTGDTQ